jgi:hypothetical protein
LEPHRFSVILDGFLVLLKSVISVSSIGISLGKIRLQTDRLVVIADGFVVSPEITVSFASAAIRWREVRMSPFIRTANGRVDTSRVERDFSRPKNCDSLKSFDSAAINRG